MSACEPRGLWKTVPRGDIPQKTKVGAGQCPLPGSALRESCWGGGGWFQGFGERGCQNWYAWPWAPASTPQQGAGQQPPSPHTHKAPTVGHCCRLYEVSPAPEEAGGAHPGLRNTTVPNPGEWFPSWPPGHTFLDGCSQARPPKGGAETAPQPLWARASQSCTIDVCCRGSSGC